MTTKFKFWLLIGCTISATVSAIGGSVTGWYCAPLFFCTAMIVDEIGKRAEPPSEAP